MSQDDDRIKALSDFELESEARHIEPRSYPSHPVFKEIHRRQEIKEKQNQKEQQEIKNDQRQIKILTAIILAFTVVILGYTIAQFYK